MKRRQHTENTHGDEGMPPSRVYPQDGIAIDGAPGFFRMRSGEGAYAVNRTGSVIRVCELSELKTKPAA